MKNWKTNVLALGLALAWMPNAVEAQLFVGGPNGEFTEFECFTTSFCSFDDDPISGDISSGGDVWIERDLEVGERIYARNLWSRATSGLDRFLNFRSVGSMTFTMDYDNNSVNGDQFEWFQDDSVNFTDQLAELEPSGDFEISGAYSSGVGSFDLAEAFLAGEELEVGQVVRVDPLRPDRVLRARGRQGVIGVVSANPGIRLGTAVFTVDQLEAWGEGVEASFRAQEPTLIQEAIALYPELGEVERGLETARATPTVRKEPGEGGPDADRVAGLEGMLREAALDLFIERTVAQVALAGRVPVKIDLDAGAIRSGDYLSASERPGLARKAVGPGPVIGVALEDATPGAETIVMLVQNGWYSGEATDLAAVDGYRALAETVAAQEAQILRLEDERHSLGARLASLERQMRLMTDERADGSRLAGVLKPVADAAHRGAQSP